MSHFTIALMLTAALTFTACQTPTTTQSTVGPVPVFHVDATVQYGALTLTAASDTGFGAFARTLGMGPRFSTTGQAGYSGAVDLDLELGASTLTKVNASTSGTDAWPDHVVLNHVGFQYTEKP